MQHKMKQFCKRVIAAACAISMVFTGLLADVGTLKSQAAGEHTMWLVGDSTVCAFNDAYYRPRYGYGTQIGNYLDDTYTVQNLAVSGTSSKSFLENGNYAKLTSGIKEGDVLVIGFGHNDEKAEEARYTNPNGDYQTEGSFAKSLYDNYVKVAQDKGAEVILCTPIVRRTTGTSFSDSQLHITSTSGDYAGGDYPAAIKKLGSDVSVPVVDLTTLTKELYQELTAAKTLYLHAWTTSKESSVDNTHLNLYGAKRVAYLLAGAIKDTDTAVAGHISLDAGYPEWDAGVAAAINGDYDVEQDNKSYDNNLTDSTNWSDYVVGDVHFKGTAFGMLGGNALDPSNYTLETDADGNMHVAAKNDKSKIAGSQDGLVMYYYKVPVNKQFSISAKATVNSMTENNQVAFGLMARDDMYIDKVDTALVSDYVVAGSFGLGSGCNCFYRKDGKIGGKAALTTETLAVGKSYQLNITSNTDGYACTFGSEPTQSAGYDFQLTTVDDEYVYIGMFASRNADITYSSIVLTVDGETLVDTSANDVAKYSVTVTTEGSGSAGADIVSAKPGEKITLNYAAGRGYKFSEWQVVSGGITVGEDNTFVMGEADVEIKAVFVVDPDYNPGEGGPIDVWDFGCAQETNTELYTNHIVAADWNGYANLTASGTFAKADTAIVFGDLTLNVLNNDRLYSTNTDVKKNYGTSALATTAYDDGYTATGMYYANGTGGNNRRHITIDNVKAGDKLIAYMASSNSADGILYFEYLGSDGTQKDSAPYTNKGVKQEFVAQYDGQYRFWTDATAGKPIYNRVVRIPGVEVTGTITYGPYTGSGATVKFVNATNGQETIATVTGGTYKATLAPGYEYTAVLSGATGYGFTNATKKLSVELAEVLTGKSHTLVVEEKSTYTFSGSVKGFEESYSRVKDLKIVMTPDADSNADPVELTIAADLTFTAVLEPDVAYTIVMTGVNDYEVTGDAVINDNQNHAADITVGLKTKYQVTGAFKDLGSAKVTALTFTNVDDEYEYTATVTDAGYSIALRDGGYLAKATVDGYTTSSHVLVDGKDVTKDLLFVSTAAKEDLQRVSDVYVGYPDKANDYATVSEAMEACERMKPATEAERITVHIAPGTYREQIIVKTPYISFVNDSSKEVLLTWYYGIGYKYYSADATGYYNPENAYDQFEKRIVEKWGTCVYVQKTATAFRAEGITFENSFNRYITDEEIEDGVEVSGLEKINVVRNYAADVQSKNATERATAICVESDEAEFVNCSFLSSQDTLYTAGAHVYYKNCLIEGQTDYIFGSGNAVFDACELSFKGYTAGTSEGGYITAVKPSADTEKGYLFRNCTVTGNDKLEVKGGYFGRPWGANAKAIFLNTKLNTDTATNLILAAGWTTMSGNDPAKANFGEYNTTTTTGAAVDTTGRVAGVMTAEAAAAIKVTDYFGTWVPVNYTEEAANLAFATKPYVVDNGDINAPYPGHTFTVGYSLGKENDANDASVIQWYRVASDETKTLVKSSTATVDKTYKVAKEDIGSHIQVVVTPATVSGNMAEAVSYTVEAAILDGYEDPSASASDVEFGDGINLFLAGDSTVKDYSAAGMYMGGKPQNEGAWGEYLQNFFDKDKVTVVNYANGGRSSRNFINEGSLDKIAANIKAGDYLFIQFGHNDCSNASGYLEDRYVPLGEPDVNGVYPVTAGTKVATPDTLKAKYGDTFYSYDCGGTYKWYLKQYIDVAKNAGAIPVLVTPVSRMYYNADGTIKPHHDSTDATTGTQVTSNNAYVTAVKQLAEEESVLLVDGFGLTKDMFEAAYTAAGNDTYGQQVMNTGEKTHNNKLGGVITAAYIATDLQNKGLNISKAVKMPEKVLGQTTTDQTVFSINGSGKLVAYDILTDYTAEAPYWEGVGQNLIDAIAAKAAELNGSGEQPGPGPVNDEGLKVRLADGETEFVYTGKAIAPAIIVTNNGEELTVGVDYTVKYANNTNASTAKPATITVTGKGNLAGTSTATFTIEPQELKEVEVGSVVVASGAKATPVLVYNGVQLTKKDFDNADAKTTYTENGTMKLTGKGNFTGDLEVPVTVVAKSELKKFKVTVSKDKFTYNGKAQTPTSITVVDAQNQPLTEEQYMIVYPEDTTSAGTVKFSVIGLGVYSGCVTKSYKIAPLKTTVNVDSSNVNSDGYAYDAAGVRLEAGTLVLTAGEETLVECKDYTVSYSANKKVGNAKYSFKFLGNYKGSKATAGTFKIVPASLEELYTDGLVQVAAIGKTVKKAGVYKTVPYVSANGTALKKSDMILTYYTDEEMTKEMTKATPVEVGGTVYVKIVGKGNYAAKDAGDFISTVYKVVNVDKTKDLSKAKIVDAKTGKALGKQEYTGEEIKPE
ncbi:MAG: hypothetical protein IJ747_06315, partial [Lachnospiraceae bacterium]|nr:hypothetical protein [Lachnospiraceae bacterium]